MIQGFLIILGCQLIGELIVVLLGLPLPGPVLGLVFMLIGLLLIGRVPDSVRNVSSGLLTNLSLLFVPAGVGLVLHFDLLAKEWWIILLALVFSTLLAAVVTALMFRWLMRAVKR
jgi:holin-like protein